MQESNRVDDRTKETMCNCGAEERRKRGSHAKCYSFCASQAPKQKYTPISAEESNQRLAILDEIERLQGELDAANQHVKILSEARDRLSHETTGSQLQGSFNISPDERDALRYRFLRQPGNAIVYAKDRDAWGKNASGHVRYDTAEQLDAAVDAAISKGSPVERLQAIFQLAKPRGSGEPNE